MSGSLASGLTINAATGVISGTTSFASGPFTVSVQDSTGAISAASASLTIASITPVSISTIFLPRATVGTAYSQALTATGGTPPYTNWSVSSGSLPPGLTLNVSSGTISGTPTSAAASPYRFNVSVQDANGATASAQRRDCGADCLSHHNDSAHEFGQSCPIRPGRNADRDRNAFRRRG